MIDLDALIASLRERAQTDSPTHALMNQAADALVSVRAERDAAEARIETVQDKWRKDHREMLAKLDKAEACIAEAAKLHRGYVNADGSRTEWCSACGNRLPCDTRRALGLNEGGER